MPPALPRPALFTPPSEPIDLDAYAAAFLDDKPLPFASVDAAEVALLANLASRFGRALNASEALKVGIALRLAWNRRAATSSPAFDAVCSCGHPLYNHAPDGHCRRRVCGCETFAEGPYVAVPRLPLQERAS